ncbi:hypothetical protein BMI91_08620 [Thioclava sediminum]|uniref:Uncharacterized protein n=1 Tax=Thioclava sediminum TaxID=1915319 RepID=A0ABX3MX46_9RHOB|nr:hypothetical protein [Thioclava sediminum]OOY24123.1 hypothetical protein BMI91_08620 [Thioclava sediminum]
MRRLIPALALLSTLTFAPTSQAADIYWAPPITDEFVLPFGEEAFGDAIHAGDSFDFKDYLHIRIEGEIETGDAEKFSEVVAEHASEIFNQSQSLGVNEKNVVVSLNSEGGDFYAGLKLSDQIVGFETYVGKGDQCLSACAIAFLGGSVRMARGAKEMPIRHIHSEAVVGFHAPFSSITSAIQVSDGTPFSKELSKLIANQFYAQAQDAINEITKRMSAWELAPDFVFAMIGKKYRQDDERPLAEQYLLLNNVAALKATKTTLVADRMTYPAQIGLLGAFNACTYVVFENTGGEAWFDAPWDSVAHGSYDVPPTGALIPTNVKRSGGPLPRLEVDGYSRTFLPPEGDDVYFFQNMMLRTGRMDCTVFRKPDGDWYVQTYSPDIHSPNFPEDRRREILDYNAPYPISNFTILGPYSVWNNFPAIEPAEWIARILNKFPDVTGPSFDCTGKLDPAAEVICLIRPLGQLDGLLGKLYGQAVERDAKATKQSQRGWLSVRDRACRPGLIDTNDPLQFRNLIDCLTFFYEKRLEQLDQIAQAN